MRNKAGKRLSRLVGNRSYAQRKMLTELEKELKSDNRRQMGELVNKWQNEREKFTAFKKEDGEVEKELLNLYKKYQLY